MEDKSKSYFTSRNDHDATDEADEGVVLKGIHTIKNFSLVLVKDRQACSGATQLYDALAFLLHVTFKL